MSNQNETTFFSYSRTDSDFVLKLARDLRNAGADIWLDQMDIKPGAHWDNAIEKALRDAHHLIVVLSPDSVNSNNVMDEVSFALENNKSVMPVLIRNCTVPFRLRRLQYVDFTTNYEAGLAQLIEVLGRHTAQQPATEQASTPTEIVATSNPDAAAPEKQTPTDTRSPEPTKSRPAEDSAIKQTPPAATMPGHASTVSAPKAAEDLDKQLSSADTTHQARNKRRTLMVIGAVVFVAVAIWAFTRFSSSSAVVADSQATPVMDSTAPTAVDSSQEVQDSIPADLIVGSEYGGGYVFHIDNSGKHGLIAAYNDILLDTDFTDSVSTATNPQILQLLETFCKERGGGGFDDWRVPTAGELRSLFDVREYIPDLQIKPSNGIDAPIGYYYSSTTDTNGDIFGKGFATGGEDYSSPIYGRVRPVRSF